MDAGGSGGDMFGEREMPVFVNDSGRELGLRVDMRES